MRIIICSRLSAHTHTHTCSCTSQTLFTNSRRNRIAEWTNRERYFSKRMRQTRAGWGSRLQVGVVAQSQGLPFGLRQGPIGVSVSLRDLAFEAVGCRRAAVPRYFLSDCGKGQWEPSLAHVHFIQKPALIGPFLSLKSRKRVLINLYMISEHHHTMMYYDWYFP